MEDADLRTDMTVNIDKTTVRADNLRASVGDSHLTGSVEVSGLQDPAIRIDLEADTIDADRYLLPVTASAGCAMAGTFSMISTARPRRSGISNMVSRVLS